MCIGQDIRPVQEESDMVINFDEELSKFRPSKEVEQAEDAIVNMNLKDMTDIMLELMKEKGKGKR